jgi:adenylosuccinate synthase
MQNVDIVIGLNYGDEGKGATTERLAHERGKGTAVVRFNGGAQAGHTVVLPDGRRHVFHHFGAGTIDSFPTILSRFFIVNPIMFWREALDLYGKLSAGLPRVYVDPNCPVTTPYDVFINQAIERARGKERHGSCGLGIGETIERHERGYSLTVADLQETEEMIWKLKEIENNYLPERLEELSIDPNLTVLADAQEIFQRDATDFIMNVGVKEDTVAMSAFTNIVMEGAQGLRIGQRSEDFPFVTRSSTGLENPAMLLEGTEADINVHYVTRTYLTRHGAGPLPGEVPNPGFKDDTNVPNEFQETLRYAPLDYERMKRDVMVDEAYFTWFDYKKKAVLTHCDQDTLCGANYSKIAHRVADAVGTDDITTTFGPARNS